MPIINFADDGTPLKRMATPDEAYSRVFGMPAGPSMTDMSALNKHTAVSNFLHARFDGLRPQLSAYDRQVVDCAATRIASPSGWRLGGCAQPTKAPVPTDDTSIRTGADSETLSPFFGLMQRLAALLDGNGVPLQVLISIANAMGVDVPSFRAHGDVGLLGSSRLEGRFPA